MTYAFTNKLLKILSIAAVLTLGGAQQGFAAYAQEDDEGDPLARIERNVVALYTSTGTTNPQAILKYNVDTRAMGWDITTSTSFKVGTKRDGRNYRVTIAQHQNSLLKTSAEEMESSSPVPLKSLRPILNSGSSLGEYVSKQEMISFIKREGLDTGMDTIPAIFKTAYAQVEDKSMFFELLEAFVDPRHTQFGIAGGPLSSLLALTLKIKNPEMPVKLVVFGYMPDYTHDFLHTVGINYENFRSDKEGYPKICTWFKKKFC